jgi:hypothetical protein
MESFNLAVINKRRLFKNHLIGTWLDSIWGKCIFLFFSGCLKLKWAIRLFLQARVLDYEEQKIPSFELQEERIASSFEHPTIPRPIP